MVRADVEQQAMCGGRQHLLFQRYATALWGSYPKQHSTLLTQIAHHYTTVWEPSWFPQALLASATSINLLSSQTELASLMSGDWLNTTFVIPRLPPPIKGGHFHHVSFLKVLA